MTPQHWQKVKEIFQSALGRAPGERSAFLASACGGDEALRQEVESLIASHEKDGSFIDSPAYLAAAELLADEQAELKPGQTIDSYEVISFISRGGMGEVYLAQDKRLGRKVALKLLPSSLTRDSDRLRRFEQEARAASALNHPNIITIHEIREANSTLMIATEFVEGETLRQRLAHYTPDFNEALHIAIQVADALAAAHKAGIIHRDIKPENIMIRPDGYVKVLDFGLAKLTEQASSMSTAEAPTKQVKTGFGMIMGTVGYMSPEQARGQTVDARSDVFNLGAVIYEMIAGQKPFDGETPSDVLAAILKNEPPQLSHFTPEAPAELVRIVTKALRKDREQRYQVVKDLLIDLKSLKEDLDFQARLDRSIAPSGTGEVSAPSSQSQSLAKEKALSSTNEIKTAVSTITRSVSAEIKRHKIGAILAVTALVLTMTVGVVALYKLVHRSQPIAPANTEAPSVENIARVTAWSGLDTQPTLSPDGNSVAYSSDHKGSFEIYVKQLTPGGREIQLTSDAQENFQPAWSPDGQRIAYYSNKRGGIWVMPALGGAGQQLTDFGSSSAWSHDGTMIAFQSDANPDLGSGSVGSSTIWIVPAQGDAPKQITKLGNPAGGHIGPRWSPDNRRIAFVALTFGGEQIWSVSITGDDLKQLTYDNIGRAEYPTYSPDGRRLYFVVRAVMWMLPLSPENGGPTGAPIKVTDVGASRISNLTLSANGKRVAFSVQTLTSNLWSAPVSQSTNQASGPPRTITSQTDVRNALPAFSLDGRKIAWVKFLRGAGTNIWAVDADGKNPVQVTANTGGLVEGSTEASWGSVPSWFPDGDQIAAVSKRGSHPSVWTISMQSRRERPLLDIGQDLEYARLSPDGKQIAFNLPRGGITNVWVASIEGQKPVQLTFDEEFAGFPCWSPDGRFIAYQIKRSDDAYVMIIPSAGSEPTQLIFDHGRSWPYSFSPDGDHIAFAGERDGIWNVYWVSRSTKQQKPLTNYTKRNAYVRYPAWSPLGDQIVYEYAETTGNIWSMELK
ncbi:MAG TPA: protein kinase [Pyrinomonadaceae bacterium]|nr:protein kinase [Pyrinomonadaceae bacterium]